MRISTRWRRLVLLTSFAKGGRERSGFGERRGALAGVRAVRPWRARVRGCALSHRAGFRRQRDVAEEA